MTRPKFVNVRHYKTGRFDILAPIEYPSDERPVFARTPSIRPSKLAWLRRTFGGKKWRHVKGFATIITRRQELWAEIHWFESHGIGKVDMAVKRVISRRPRRNPASFAVCLKNNSDPASLVLGKIYPIWHGELEGFIRLINEDGEDYYYSMDDFVEITLPESLKRKLTATLKAPSSLPKG